MIDFITFHIWLRKHAAGLCQRTCQHTSTKVQLFPVWTSSDSNTATADRDRNTRLLANRNLSNSNRLPTPPPLSLTWLVLVIYIDDDQMERRFGRLLNSRNSGWLVKHQSGSRGDVFKNNRRLLSILDAQAGFWGCRTVTASLSANLTPTRSCLASILQPLGDIELRRLWASGGQRRKLQGGQNISSHWHRVVVDKTIHLDL